MKVVKSTRHYIPLVGYKALICLILLLIILLQLLYRNYDKEIGELSKAILLIMLQNLTSFAQKYLSIKMGNSLS